MRNLKVSEQTELSLKLLLPLLAAIIAISPLAIDMYLPAMPILAEHLSTDMPMVQNSLSIYLLGYALGLLFFGPQADKHSRRKLVMLGISGFIVMSIAITFVTSIEQFLSLRFFQAFISSAATVVVPGTIKERYGKDTAKGFS
ncbi:MFS transporter, partial [Colwellia sp. BRX8-8]|nr:MFS transporter [Colwellia sp. BRX8-8]